MAAGVENPQNDPPADVEVDRQSLGEFLDQLAARLPAPGAGASAAIEAALAASLVAMVGRFTTGDRFDHGDEIREIVRRADVERGACLDAAAADEVAFTAVTEAYQLPRGTPEEEEARRRAIGAAQAEAARPPSAVIRSAEALVSLAERLLPIANPNLVSDVAAATAAARAAATTARLAVEVNLPGVPDDEARHEFAAVVASVDDLARRADAVEVTVRSRLPS
jgi:formiminotetrahydrofolate cyclodeaminase